MKWGSGSGLVQVSPNTSYLINKLLYTETLTDETLLKIARQINDDQPYLGVHLGIEYDDIQTINERFQDRFVEATMQVLQVSA